MAPGAADLAGLRGEAERREVWLRCWARGRGPRGPRGDLSTPRSELGSARALTLVRAPGILKKLPLCLSLHLSISPLYLSVFYLKRENSLRAPLGLFSSIFQDRWRRKRGRGGADAGGRGSDGGLCVVLRDEAQLGHQRPADAAGACRSGAPGALSTQGGGEEGQVLSGTVGRAPLHIPESPQMERDSTHSSVLPWGVLKAELGLEISSPSVFLALVGKHNKSGGIC